MADTSTPPPSAPEGKDGNQGGAPDGTKDKEHENDLAYWRQEALENRSRRDSLGKRLRAIEDERDQLKREREEFSTKLSSFESKFSEIEEAKRKAEDEAAKQSGNWAQVNERLENRVNDLTKALADKEADWLSREAEYKSKLEASEHRFYENFVEKTLLEELGKPGISSHAKTSLMYLKKAHQFEPVQDEDGIFVGVRAKGSEKSIQDLHDELVKQQSLEFLKPNGRLEGTGAKPPEGSSTPGKVTKLPPESKNWSYEDRVRFYRDNPDAKPE